MGKVVKRMILTGGPCAGKSSSLDLIREYITNLGYYVLVVNESATELINSGIKPFGENSVSMIEFQDIVLRYQMFKEKLVMDTANKFYSDEKIVIIYDRGMVDYKAYIGEVEYDKLLSRNNLNEDQILNKFDIVIHLETAAKSKDYTQENNRARSESVEEAIELDNKIFDAWSNHTNLYKVKAYDYFVDKQNEIINILDSEFNN